MEQDHKRHDNQTELNRLITTMNKNFVSSGEELWDHSPFRVAWGR